MGWVVHGQSSGHRGEPRKGRNTLPFDANGVATATLRDKTILGTEHLYDKIKGKRLDPKEIKEKL